VTYVIGRPYLLQAHCRIRIEARARIFARIPAWVVHDSGTEVKQASKTDHVNTANKQLARLIDENAVVIA